MAVADSTQADPAPEPAPVHPRFVAAPRAQGLAVGKVVLEVVLITLGVFLALWVDEWRERADHRELAEATLRRFRAEFVTNRAAVAAVRGHHTDGLERIRAYFAADPIARSKLAYPSMATHPAFLEYSAWDLALATQALAYIEPDLAQAVAHVYAAQRQLDGATRDITLVMYSKGGDADPVPFTSALAIYYGDCNLIEPRLLKLYDEVIARLDARGPS